MPLDNLKRKIEALEDFDWERELYDIILRHAAEAEELQRDQMQRGLDADGEYIRPFYSENPYFKTRKQARDYAEWKQRISPGSDRPMDVPNLFINGFYQYSLHLQVSGTKYDFASDVAEKLANEIESVHKNVIGLNPEYRQQFYFRIVRKEMKKLIEEKLGLTLKDNWNDE